MYLSTILRYLLPTIFLCLLIRCTPANDEVTEEHIDIEQPVETEDTLTTTAQDGVQAPLPEKELVLPLPQPVLALLNDRYPNWQQPLLAPEIASSTTDQQGPMQVRGDFNNDALQDIALQLQSDKNAIIVAFVQDITSNYKLYELKQDILLNDRGQLTSLFSLNLIQRGTELKVFDNKEILTLKADAIVVDLAGSTTIYVYKNGSFISYAPKK